MRHDVIHGDCLEVLREMPAQSIDAVVTDPPYGLGEVKDLPGLLMAWMSDADDRQYTGRAGFMGKGWDRICPGPRYWREVYRVMKPGAHLLCFAGTRTWDLASLAIRLAGFENRDTISHEGALRFYHGQGFPKGLDIGKALDRLAGIECNDSYEMRPEHQRVAYSKGAGAARCLVCGNSRNGTSCTCKLPPPATEEAKKWDGWNAALKPAWEIILVFRRPLEQPSIARNVLKWGCGGLNIGECRVGLNGDKQPTGSGKGFDATKGFGQSSTAAGGGVTQGGDKQTPLSGRWSPNLLFSHLPGCERIGTTKVKAGDPDRFKGIKFSSDAVYAQDKWSKKATRNTSTSVGDSDGMEEIEEYRCVDGCRVKALDEMSGASRFFPQFHDSVEWGAFYTAKASKRERTANGTIANQHPCVKALSLVRWLVRLVGIPGGTILDPYAGSGTTGVACVHEGFDFVGIEAEEEYCEIARARIAHAGRQVSERLPL